MKRKNTKTMDEITNFTKNFIDNLLEEVKGKASLEGGISFEIPVVKKKKSGKILFEIVSVDEDYPKEKIIKIKIKELKIKHLFKLGELFDRAEEYKDK